MPGEMLTIFHLSRLHTAIAEWLFAMLYILPRRKRFSPICTVCISLGFLGLLIAANLLGEYQKGFMWLLFMMLCIALMIALMHSTCKQYLRETLYYWARAFLAAEFAASLEWQITYYALHAPGNADAQTQQAISYGILAATYSVVALILYYIDRKKASVRNRFHVSWRESMSALTIALSAFAIGNFNFAFQNNLFTESMGAGVLYARTLVDLGGIIMLFGHDAQRLEMSMAYELEATNTLMQRQYEQYQQYRQNDEALHRLYHDLKHQIAFIRAEQDIDRREKYLSEMDEVIRRHEAATETGDTVLDTLLTGKNLTCIEKRITMTCFTDAKQLGFMDVMDVCSIFGNALDNAIEYEEKIEDEKMRLIKVTAYEQGAFYMIRIENYCGTAIPLDGDAPHTNKKDKRMHGYGIKSIRRAAQKYGGHLSFANEDGWFRLTILIPLEKGA